VSSNVVELGVPIWLYPLDGLVDLHTWYDVAPLTLLHDTRTLSQ
jgi:hypothetical protein